MKKITCAVFISSLLAACGGGGGNPSAGPSPSAAGAVAQQCATPRPAGSIDPLTGQAYGDVQGSLSTEKLWIRSFVNDTYLWYQDVVALDPALFVLGATAPYINPVSYTHLTLPTNREV